MFPPKVRTVYEAFWEMLPMALVIAETKHNYPGIAAAAYWRLLKFEVIPGIGNTGYVNNLDPAVCVSQYVSYVYKETNVRPDFLDSIEGR